MYAKVLIRRRFKEGGIEAISSLMKRVRSDAMRQRGYVSGEMLINFHDHHELLVISTWKSLEYWSDWARSETRFEEENLLSTYLEGEPTYEYYLVGES